VNNATPPHIGIVGAGFTGLAAAYDLVRQGVRVTLFESAEEIGGLAGSFQIEGVSLERFYHHWFNHDSHILGLIDDLGLSDHVLLRSTRTGMYYANRILRLSTPLDLLRFDPLPLLDRVRLGLLTLRARRVADWRPLERISAAEWLRKLGGERVYRVVWEPLLKGKFGDHADEVAAVWMWNKLKLRGGSRGKGGGEQLAYFRGGFAALADQLSVRIRDRGGAVLTRCRVESLHVAHGRLTGVRAGGEDHALDGLLLTPALPIVADLLAPHVDAEYTEQLRQVRYLANVCQVFVLDRSLSDTYWVNVNDPGFPFVAVIEHTNFEPPETYGGRHIVYLSKYLPESAPMYAMDDEALLAFTVPHLKRMFPDFSPEWIVGHHVWRERFTQPLVGLEYSRQLPGSQTPLANVWLASMAQIYPEDRGTNYAIREGRRAAGAIAARIATGTR
jgi:protoporphyrinogen oxidase